jgi:DNA-binding transcriptional MerR regulator
MKIGELGERTRVPTRLLRYYEEQALLQPTRMSNGYRFYSEDDVTRVTTIRGLINSGMTTRLIRVVLDMEALADAGLPASCSDAFAAMLTGELAKLDDQIECLTKSRSTVEQFLASAATSV